MEVFYNVEFVYPDVLWKSANIFFAKVCVGSLQLFMAVTILFIGCLVWNFELLLSVP